eukprot:1382782-Rhodomonas_salina.1
MKEERKEREKQRKENQKRQVPPLPPTRALVLAATAHSATLYTKQSAVSGTDVACATTRRLAWLLLPPDA